MSEIPEQKNEEREKEFASEAEEIASIEAQAAEQQAAQQPEDEVAQLRRQLEALTADLQRERAEFSNFRKRAVQEKAQQAAQSSARLLTDLLPALDAFDQFLAAYMPKAEADSGIKAIVDGVQLVHKQITRVFTESGVEEINPIGLEFDPNLMEALSLIEADVEKETVSQVFQKGYRIEGRVIRPARVVVTKPRAEEKKES
ncbi:MAG: nucleotide exchange factor GrpE [Turneriella sp.]